MNNNSAAVWVSQSVSWLPNELEELKRFAKAKGMSLSAYIRALTRRDRHRRLKILSGTASRKNDARKGAK